jgi:DNA polymerase-3 subunit gamma/tau
MDQGVVQVRRMWPDILEAVKNRRRFTWILLSQNAQVMGFDGTTLQLGFSNPGARDSFVGGGSEDVLRQALSDALGVQWTIEAIVDPSGGAGSPTGPQGGAPAPGSGLGGGGGSGSGSGFSGPASDSGFGGGGRGGPSSGSYADASAPSRPVSPQASSAPPAAPPPRAAGPAPAPAPAPEPAPGSRSEREAEPPPIAPRDNMSLEDDPAPHHTALSGHDLIVRELGATVVEEFTSE